MVTRTSIRRHRAALGLCMVLGLAGCHSIYTIHSIAEPGHEPSTVPDISGLWVPGHPELAGLVLRIAAEDYDIGRCRNADIRVMSAYTNEDIPVGDQICFIHVAGHLVAQLRTTGQMQFYQQALFRFDQQSLSFCSAIWADLSEWSTERPRASAVHGLEFARRERETWFIVGGTKVLDLFVTSPRNVILAYLESRLPEVRKACDESDTGDSSGWITYTRLTPPRLPDAADRPPSPQN